MTHLAVTRDNPLSGAQVHPAAEVSSTFDTKYITGLGAVDQRMLILVDIEKLMSGADVALIDTAASSTRHDTVERIEEISCSRI